MAAGDLAAAVQSQFHAQLAALGALQDGRLPPESTLLAACGGKIPVAAAKELAEAARAQQQLQQPSSNGGPAGAQDAADDAELPDAQRLQAAIRKKLQQLTPCKRKVEQEVLLEKSLQQQCSEFQLLDWRRMRRPLPGSNHKAFEAPLQPMVLLTQQAAVRAQRAAMTAKADRLRLQRAHLERQQQGPVAGGPEEPQESGAQQQQQHDRQPAVQTEPQSALDVPSQALPLRQALVGGQESLKGQQPSSPTSNSAAGELEREETRQEEARQETQGT